MSEMNTNEVTEKKSLNFIEQAVEKVRQEQEELERARQEEIEELERMADLERQLEELKQKHGK